MWPAKSLRRSKRLEFLQHLEELRLRLLVSLGAVTLFSVIAYFFSTPILDFLTFPLREISSAELYFHAPYEAFVTHLKVALLLGVLAASPILFAELWLFLAPGLHQKEKKVFLPLIFASALFFLGGAAFAFWVMVPFSLKFLLNFQTVSLQPLLGVNSYFSFLGGMIIAFGILFDLPVVVLGLVKGGILTQESLREARKIAFVLIFVLAAVLTPSPDPFGQLLLAVPLLLLYEACVFAAKWMGKKKVQPAAQRISEAANLT